MMFQISPIISFLPFLLIIVKALLITIILELVALLFQRERDYRIYLIVILMNIFTNISFNIGIQFVTIKPFFLVIVGLEILIVLIESIGYYIFYKNCYKAIRVSLICNITSYLLGLLLL